MDDNPRHEAVGRIGQLPTKWEGVKREQDEKFHTKSGQSAIQNGKEAARLALTVRRPCVNILVQNLMSG